MAAMPVLAAFTLVPSLYGLVFGVTSLGFITCCQELHKWEQSIAVAEARQHGGLRGGSGASAWTA